MPQPGLADPKEVTPRDLAQVRDQAEFLCNLVRAEPALARQAGVTARAMAELEDAALQSTEAIKVPSARAMFIASLGPAMNKDLVLTLYHRTVRAMHALAPLVGMKLAEKMDNHQAPGSTRVILELAKGLGLLIPAEPMAAKGRMDLMEEDALRNRSTEELRDEALRFST